MKNSTNFPYHSIPRNARWREVMENLPTNQIDPHFIPSLKIQRNDLIASAGSCFAQRISTALQQSGYQYLVTEKGPDFLSSDEKKKYSYGQYSARYGNIYTVLQLLQLMRRAFGRFDSVEPVWRLKTGGYVDPFRSAVQPDGFISEQECLRDRQSHLAAVRKMFETVNIFIFTLGLTECWLSQVDGSVFPNCPGSSLGGEFDTNKYVFHNFSVLEVIDHIRKFLDEFKQINPSAQVILTVSPVPLLATYEPRHVLQSTVYSKSVLRVACEEIIKQYSNVHYFASYEIVTSTGDISEYFHSDRRSVSNTAVSHVIQCFHNQFTDADAQISDSNSNPIEVSQQSRPICDEELVMAALADTKQAEAN